MNQRSDEFAGFQERVYARALTASNYSFFPDEEVNVHVVGYADALRVYVDVVREIVVENSVECQSRGGDPWDCPRPDLSDGASIAKRMRNRTFRSVAGFKRLNGNGDVDGNFLIKSYSNATKQLEVCGSEKWVCDSELRIMNL